MTSKLTVKNIEGLTSGGGNDTVIVRTGNADRLTVSNAAVTVAPQTTFSGGISNLVRVQTFSSNGVYTPASGVTRIRVEMVGGGGGAGNADTDTAGQGSASVGGGGAGGIVTNFIPVTSSYTANVTIGLGGAGGAAGESTTDGSNGTNSVYFDGTNTYTANGGFGGLSIGNVSGTQARPGPEGGYATFSGLAPVHLMAGGPGESNFVEPDDMRGGAGGFSMFGGGARGQDTPATNTSVAGRNAVSKGAGGGGAVSRDSVSGGAKGGDGANGYCVIYEYL